MRSVFLVAATITLAACNQQSDTTSPATGDEALDQSATMGTTTQESVSGTEMSAGDATGATAPAGTGDQYGNFSAAAGGGDATADTAVGGQAGAVSGNSTTGLSGTSGVTASGQDKRSGSPQQ